MRHLSWLLLLCGPSEATPPLKIESQQAHYDETTGIAVHEGEVVVKQGKRTLSADKVLIYRTAHKITKVVAFGERATLHCVRTPQADIWAYAKTMEYEPDKEKVILRHHAEFAEADDIITGDVLRYCFASEHLQGAKTTSTGRVTMTLQPTSPLLHHDRIP